VPDASLPPRSPDKGKAASAAYEVRAPKDVDCRRVPDVAAGRRMAPECHAPAYDAKPMRRKAAAPASLLLPEGTYGRRSDAAQLLRHHEYNFSDLYVLFVGHLSERITDPRPFETP
jgi:membrane-bound lytic murein transglycosylase B